MSEYRSDRPDGKPPEFEPDEGARPSSATRGVAVLAGVLVIAVVLGIALIRRAGELFGTGGETTGLIAPEGFVAPATSVELRWHTTPDAERYYVYMTRASGDTVFAVNTQDTTYVVPSTVDLELGEEYRWWTVAVMPDGSHRRQSPLEFTLGRP